MSELGPIFEIAIGDRWDRAPGPYDRLLVLGDAHLGPLFRQSHDQAHPATGDPACRISRDGWRFLTTPRGQLFTRDCAESFIVKAHNIARSLQLGMFFRPDATRAKWRTCCGGLKFNCAFGPPRKPQPLWRGLLLILGFPFIGWHPVHHARASSLPRLMPCAAAASRYQSPRQFRQNPAVIIMSIFCTSLRSRSVRPAGGTPLLRALLWSFQPWIFLHSA